MLLEVQALFVYLYFLGFECYLLIALVFLRLLDIF